MHMNLDPEGLAGLDVDPKREAEVLAWLRQQDEVTKFAFVWRTLRANPGIGVLLVKRGQLRPADLEPIIEHVSP